MTDKPTPKPKRRVSLVRSSYQPSKKELAETEKMLDFPEGTTPEDLAKAVVQDVEIDWKDRPE